MNIQEIMKQAQKMQKNLENAQAELASKEYEETAGGAVKVKIDGNLSIKSLEIDEEILEKDNKEMLEELIMFALNSVIAKANEDKEKVMKAATGGASLPGMF